MSTHRLTVDISEESYRILRQAVDAGDFASESAALDDLITDLLFDKIPEKGNPGYEEYEKRLHEELLEAVAEYEANPDDVFTSEEVLAHLAEDRTPRAQ